ncbi:hypothetical protein YA0016_08630 [Pseudomonas syringae]|uniref:hypothetical protein n=1 Tax=Pseudomonas syringae group TaxID=136849 RepID=UPI000D1FFF65|nr:MULTISPECIES: hypothetical protein [Pseudomonas syringae group]AVI85597.1 hypothetical protein XJ28_18755 [Pseudomonas syringae pv. tomato]MBI6841796.1 hypothetical protein [Pseudomonas syringae]
MEANRENLRALAVSIEDLNDAVRNQIIQQGGDIHAALAKERDYVFEVMADLDEKDVILFQQLHTEELERRVRVMEESAKESERYLAELEVKRSEARDRWIVDGKISRSRIRDYVNRDSDILVAAASRGENVHQMALDQMDAFHEHLIVIPHEHSDTFNRIYLEELNANSNFLQSEATRIVKDADALNQKTAEKIAKAEDKGKVLGFIILAVIVVAFLVAVKH